MKSEKKKKKRGFFGVLFGTIGLLLLIVLVSALSFAAYLLISMNRDPVVSRTLQEYVDTQPDETFQHLAFTSDGIMTQSFSEDDIGYFIGRLMMRENIDPESFLEYVPVPDLKLKGFDLKIGEGNATVCVEGAWRKIRIVGRAVLSVRFEDGKIIVSPDAFQVARIKIPVRLIDKWFHTDLGSQSISYAPDPLLLKEFSKVTAEEGKLSFTGPLTTKILDYDQVPENRIRVTRLSQSRYAYAAAVLDTEGDDPAVRYSVILPGIEEHPEEFTAFLDQLFTITSATATRKVGLNQNNFNMALRWFPEFEEYSYDSRRQEAYDEYYVCFRFLQTISTKIYRDYAGGKLRANGSGFSYQGEPFTFEDFFGSNYKLYRPFFGMDDGRMCIARKKTGASTEPAMLLRGKDGCGFVVVINRPEDYSILPLKEEIYRQYLASDTVPEILLSDTDQFTV